METDKSQELANQEAFEADPTNRVVVPKRLASPGRLVALTGRVLKKARPDQYGRLSTRKEDCLDLSVSPGQLSRGLRLMDGLIKALERRGFEVSPKKTAARGTAVTVLGEEIEFGLDEVVRRSDHQPTKAELDRQADWSWRTYPAYDYRPTGHLRLTIKEYWPQGSQKQWVDGKSRRVEDQLNKFIVGLVRTALGLRAKAEEREAQERVWADQRARALAIKEAEDMEAARQERLGSQADLWAKARTIRAFVSAVRQASSEVQPDQSRQLEGWAGWALKVADQLDPIGEGLEGVLDGHIDH